MSGTYIVAPANAETDNAGDAETHEPKSRSRVVLAGATAAAVAAALVFCGRHLTNHDSLNKLSDQPSVLYTAPEACRTAQVGEQCFRAVQWTMATGFYRNPSDYPGLSPKSRFSDFQMHLYKYSADTSGCSKPCQSAPDCATADEASACGQSVTEAITTFYPQHPEWYPELTATSSREDFQRHINHDTPDVCPTAPCSIEPYALPTLFCWSVVMPMSYENALMQAQFQAHAGIFACDDNAIVSDTPLDWYPASRFIDSTRVTGKSKDGFSPNAPTFVKAWWKIQEDGRWSNFDWIVKTDPDAVLIPGRLRMKLEAIPYTPSQYSPNYATNPSSGVFVTNCDKMKQWGQTTWSNKWPMMFGSMEVISRDALRTYFVNSLNCARHWNLKILGEDDFMGKCLRALKVGEYFMRTSDQACWKEPVNCAYSDYPVFHPKKDIPSWFQCWSQVEAAMAF